MHAVGMLDQFIASCSGTDRGYTEVQPLHIGRSPRRRRARPCSRNAGRTGLRRRWWLFWLRRAAGQGRLFQAHAAFFLHAPRRGQLDDHGRANPQPRALHEDDQLEIPAFLRRQSN